ncbi:hypothetical protein ASG99_25185 [Bacillus sp. Soil768D1]|nr:hypothetical protein ASG99_25185 [Bacillus sp. Soil768D1]
MIKELVFYKSCFFNAAKKLGAMCKKSWRKVPNILSIEGIFLVNLLKIAVCEFGMKIAYIQKRDSNFKLGLFESL